jgi:hypothetical protein
MHISRFGQDFAEKIASQAEKCIQYTDFISFGVLCTDWENWRKGFAMHK